MWFFFCTPILDEIELWNPFMSTETEKAHYCPMNESMEPWKRKSMWSVRTIQKIKLHLYWIKKISWINLIKYIGIIHKSYIGSYKTLKTEIKEDWNKPKDILCTHLRIINIVSMSILSCMTYHVCSTFITTSMTYFSTEIDKTVLKYLWTLKSPQKPKLSCVKWGKLDTMVSDLKLCKGLWKSKHNGPRTKQAQANESLQTQK